MADVNKWPLVDTHAHFWRADSDGARGSNPHDHPVSPAGLVSLMDESRVGMTLQVTRYFEPNDAESVAGAAEYPDRYRVLCRVDSTGPGAPERLRRAVGQDYVVGIRVFDSPANAGLLGQDGEPFWAAAEQSGLPVSIYMPGLLGELRALAIRYPAITFVLDHCAMRVDFSSDPRHRLDDWESMLRLAVLPNVLVKASGLPEMTVERYPFPRAQDLFRELIAAFGANRVMWGSNWTPAACTGRYDQLVAFARTVAAELPEREGRRVLGGSACAVFSLP